MLKTRIRQHELGLYFRHGDFSHVLQPGSYWIPARLLGGASVEVIDPSTTRFKHRLLDALLMHAEMRDLMTVAELADGERAFVWIDGRLEHILGPGRHAFWKEPRQVEIEVHNVDRVRFEHPRMEAVLAHPDASQFLRAVQVDPREQALFFHEGRLIDSVESGTHVFWKLVTPVTWKSVDLREQTLDVSGQEIMTADKVSVRMNLLITYQVTDGERALTEVDDYQQVLYRESQLALRAAVGGRELDQLLGDKQAVDVEVQSALAQRATELGVNVKSVGLRDVILPGDMKSILNQVIEAQKQAEANLIRRREETAAARSQANTARLLAENPILVRMKEMEALQETLKGTRATFVLGRGTSCTNSARSPAPKRPATESSLTEESASGSTRVRGARINVRDAATRAVDTTPRRGC